MEHNDQLMLGTAAARPRWESPRIVVVGHIRDLVQGGGKSGTNSDSDPQNTTKKGVG